MGIKAKRVFFEKEALDYPIGKEIIKKLRKEDIPIDFLKSHNRVTGIPGKDSREAFFQGKNTLVVGVRRTLDFATCKPSAHYQLPLVTGCEGICEYCYLNTQMGKKPYTRVYVNVDDILAQAKKYIEERKPDVTFFEAAATSDPIPVEPYSGALKKAIEFFASEELGRLRFVTKFNQVDTLLDIDHKKHTRIRFSINSDKVIKNYEHRTPKLATRLETLSRVVKHGYPSGVIIAPVVLENGWKEDYKRLLVDMKYQLGDRDYSEIDFEVISHRFTRKARSNIIEVFPDTKLSMDEEKDRQFKYGQFGYGKYVYTKDMLKDMENFFRENINDMFPGSEIKYVI
ncbi:Spore photoproduct lyase [Candidatus Syntrophocurvum alkaliphilum]|uniref:Spore photoproduct lyase n=1 Tax=Candidatus Syntrophocurvum alkaliphilum TaxID=2293317 RepID=A0A6I6DFF9_9FIRM|nr:spore photoproduct lyase [Candidatus Syntrophocurvum alkaliphilum]QGT99817.1 Spore photoproduct lyase [Candidatus Syntrophocurvum alkaliphilum]